MNGIDIASHQNSMDVTKVDADFVIIKATQGDYYVNPYFEKHRDQAKKSGKLIGAYHYSNGITPVEKEVDFFIKTIKKYISTMILCLDWESNGITERQGLNHSFKSGTEVDYVKEFADILYKKTGIYPFIYMSASVTRRSDWSKVSKNCPLWVAQYKNKDLTGYQENPYRDSKGLGAWKSEAIRQYTSSGTIKGYEQKEKGKLDLDKAYISRDAWISYANGTGVKEVKKVDKEIIKKVLSNELGKGEERKKNVEKLGYSYEEVRAVVNYLIDIENKVKDLKKDAGIYWDIILGRC